jgi:hypothetical protein
MVVPRGGHGLYAGGTVTAALNERTEQMDDASEDAQPANAFDEYLAAIREYLHRGWLDYFAGVPVHLNPYAAGTVAAEHWARGWQAASYNRLPH